MNYRFLPQQRTYPPNGGQLHGLNDIDTGPDALAAAINAREQRVADLLNHGEMFWLPVGLGLGTTPASGTTFQSVTTSVDFDLLIVGADATIFLSLIDIRDSARQRLLTNGPTPIGAIADFQVSGTLNQFRNNWYRPYLLPAKSQFALTVTANGTESNGILTFYCLQPPVYNG